MTKRNTSTIQVIDRMAWLLDTLSNSDKALSLKHLAADTGLHPSTGFRILAAMSVHGLVERDESGYYRLGQKLRYLAGRVHAPLDLREEAKAIMESLRDTVGETVNLTVPEGDEVVYVERAISHRAMRVEQVIGSRAPLHVTAVGKLILGDAGESAIRAYARRKGLTRYTQNTITRVSNLISEINRALQLGYAQDNEEAEQGVGCIGVVIRDSTGVAVAGLSISAPKERLRAEWIPLIVQAGQDLSERLGYREQHK